MQPTHLIVDGNNLLHAWRSRAELARDFAGGRQALARMLDKVTAAINADLLLVFDGTMGGRDDSLSGEGIEVLYATPDTPADTVIERHVRTAPRPQDLLIVSSDLGVQRTCSAAGAEVMGCPQFLAWGEDRVRSLGEQARRNSGRKPGPTLGDFFPQGPRAG